MTSDSTKDPIASLQVPTIAPDSPVFAFPVVGIGASAGGLKAIIELIDKIPAEPGFALVVVVHLDPNHPSDLVSILAKSSRVPVAKISDGLEILQNHMYVIPPDSDLYMQNNFFRLMPRALTAGRHLPINTFFRSLASTVGSQATGVILSGTGSDGGLGLEIIKQAGGVCFVQDAQSAQFSEMPEYAMQLGCADFVLPPADIAVAIIRMVMHNQVIQNESRLSPDHVSDDRTLAELFRIINDKKNVDFSGYKQATILRRIQRRMIIQPVSTYQDYLAFVKQNPDEVNDLFNDLLINVTSFFRDSVSFDAMKAIIFPHLISKSTSHGSKSLRLWVPGCSTGEEVYSIAIALVEFLSSNNLNVSVQIFATDISEKSIAKARIGIYPEEALGPISQERLAQFFSRTERGLQINKNIRDMVIFASHNVIKDPPFSRLDFICCRNLLIYFSAPLQANVLSMFHFALKPEGMLLLGPSESLGESTDLFRIVDKKLRIYERATGSVRQYADNLIDNYYARAMPGSLKHPNNYSVNHEDELAREVDTIILGRFAPSGFVVNESMKIIQFRGNTSVFLGPTPGQPNFSLHDLLKPELRHAVRAAVTSSIKSGDLVADDNISLIGSGSQQLLYTLHVLPLQRTTNKPQYFLVLFSPRKQLARHGESDVSRSRWKRRFARLFGQFDSVAEDANRKNIADLESARKQLENLTIDRDLTLEELRTSNEEILSANEELQSSNEELETAKEELQSSNEELRTVNDELQVRNFDLGLVKDDLANIIDSTNMPLILMSRELTLRRFTPAAERLLGLLPSDVGRNISHVKFDISIEGLQDLCLGVLQTMQFVEKQVQDQHGRWQSMSIRPYRTSANKIDGLIVGFFDVNALTTNLNQKGIDFAERIVATARGPLVVLDGNGFMKMGNEAFYKYLRRQDTAPFSGLFFDVSPSVAHSTLAKDAINSLLNNGTEFRNVEVELEVELGQKRIFLMHGWEIYKNGSKDKRVLLDFDDVTESKRYEEAMRRILNAAPLGVIQTRKNGEIVFVTDEVVRIYGYGRSELIGMNIDRLIPPRHRSAYHADVTKLFNDRAVRPLGTELNLAGLAKSGREVPIDTALVPVEFDGELFILNAIVDMTARLSLQHSILAAEVSDQANKSKSRFIATMSHEIRTPLAAVIGFAEQIMKNPKKSENYAIIIQRNAIHLSKLIDEVLDLSKVEANQINLEQITFNIRNEIDGAVSMLSGAAATKGIRLSVEYSSNLPILLQSDPTRLRQILVNVIGNSMKFTDKGDVIVKVGVTERKNEAERLQLRILVSDTGCGIDPEMHSTIFEPFSQSSASTTRLYGGTGLGLTLSRQLARLLGGDVKLMHSTPDIGSVFEITVDFGAPAVQLEVDRISKDKSKRTLQEKLKGLRILLVEDSPDISFLVSQILNSSGTIVTTAADGELGLKAALTQSFDLILMDINLPKMDGKTVTRRIRESNTKIPIIALTAHATKEESLECIEAGMNQYCTKPISSAELLKVVAFWGADEK
jgi:two-component system CheB/CheR fusion protein